MTDWLTDWLTDTFSQNRELLLDQRILGIATLPRRRPFEFGCGIGVYLMYVSRQTGAGEGGRGEGAGVPRHTPTSSYYYSFFLGQVWNLDHQLCLCNFWSNLYHNKCIVSALTSLKILGSAQMVWPQGETYIAPLTNHSTCSFWLDWEQVQTCSWMTQIFTLVLTCNVEYVRIWIQIIYSRHWLIYSWHLLIFKTPIKYSYWRSPIGQFDWLKNINRNPPSVPNSHMGTNFHKFFTEKWFGIGRNGLHRCVGVR